MEKELKDLLTEFQKVTDQIIDLKQVGMVVEPVLRLQKILLEEIIKLLNSNVECIDTTEYNF